MRYAFFTTLVLMTAFSLVAMPALGNSTGPHEAGLQEGTASEKQSIAETPDGLAPDPAEYAEQRFSTVEEAAVAALQHTDRRSIRKGRRHLYVGTIVRIGESYGFERARHSGEVGRASWRPQARVNLGREHVATFVVHPRTGDRRVDRLHEKFSPGQRRFVDDVDALHRPMFMLTPSGRIVRYGHSPAVGTGTSLVATSH